MKKWIFAAGALLAGASSAQNPMNVVNEPEYDGGSGPGWVLILVIGAYAVVCWFLFAGPGKHWASENPGLTWLLLGCGLPLGILMIAMILK